MSEPRIVTPDEACVMLKDGDHDLVLTVDWAYTVANETDRIRAAVVKALRNYADAMDRNPTRAAIFSWHEFAEDAREWAQGIEDGAPWVERLAPDA